MLIVVKSSMKNIIEKILRDSGEIILKNRLSIEKVDTKSKNEIVTPTDIQVNDFIVEKLTVQFPDIPIYTEEDDSKRTNSSTRWILDPIDGTTPWVWGNSGFSISLALEKDNEIVLGAVYDPIMRELFLAESGTGAFKNNEPIHVNNDSKIKDMFFVVDWGNSDEKRTEGLKYFERFFIPDMFARRIVPQWAPALGICKIAEGRIHGLICNDTWLEDHSAASLILKEAGGSISNFYNTNKFEHRQNGIIATNTPETHKIVVNFLKQ